MIACRRSVIIAVIQPKPMKIATALLCITGLSLLCTACETNVRQEVPENRGSVTSDSNPTYNWPNNKWQKLSSNEWFELFKLDIKRNESFLGIVYHKTDAQLGIAMSVLIARNAKERGFAFCRLTEISSEGAKRELPNGLLPDGPKLVFYYRVIYSDKRPNGDDADIIDVMQFAQIPLDSDKP